MKPASASPVFTTTDAAQDAAGSVVMTALDGLPEVVAGDDLVTLVCRAVVQAGLALRDGDVLVLAQKIVSKSEGRRLDLTSVTPSPQAQALAERTHKDPRLVEAVLSQSEAVLRAKPGVLVVSHRKGWVMANAGIDQSNLPGAEANSVLLLPENPDASARALRAEIRTRLGVEVCVVIADSFGRAWRLGVVGVAIGSAGFEALEDWRGRLDRQDRPLAHTDIARADEIAAAAGLLMGQAGEGRPVVLMRGLVLTDSDHGSAADLIRPAHEDMFR